MMGLLLLVVLAGIPPAPPGEAAPATPPAAGSPAAAGPGDAGSPARRPKVAAPKVAAPEAADGAALDEELHGAVITASGSEEARSLAAANVTSIGWEEIARRGYRSLADILADVPGLYVVDDLVRPAVSVRGISPGLRGGTRLVKVMINGVPVHFRPDLTALIGPEYVPVEAIERVEIAKGPLSALYGANAFLATVNVITRGRAGAALVAEASARR